MQVLDESMLDADVQLGGVDQRKIFMLSWDWAHKIGKERCTYLMNSIMPSLTYGKTYMHTKQVLLDGSKNKNKVMDKKQLEDALKESLKKQSKMSASNPNGKIAFADTDNDVERKINKAFCLDGDDRLDLNAVLCMVKYIILPLQGHITVLREEKHGGDKKYDDFMQLLEDWKSKTLVAADLKPAVTLCIQEYVRFMRKRIASRPHLREKAYS